MNPAAMTITTIAVARPLSTSVSWCLQRDAIKDGSQIASPTIGPSANASAGLRVTLSTASAPSASVTIPQVVVPHGCTMGLCGEFSAVR